MKVQVSSFQRAPIAQATAPANGAQQQEEDKPTLRDSYRKAVTTAAFASGGATAGYFMGSTAGALVNNIGASARYLSYGPLVGASLGASWGLLAYRQGEDDAMTRFIRGGASMGTGASLGMVAGDALGHALTGITGIGAYSSMGAAAGTLTGSLIGLAHNRKDGQDNLSKVAKGAASLATGATTGWFLGGGAGALVGHLSGNAQVVMVTPVLAAVSGGLIGLAAYLTRDAQA